MDKFWRAEQMIRAECPAARITPVQPAPVLQLLRVHTASYLTSIRTGSLSRDDLVRLGLPACEGLLTRSRRETAGTVAAMWAALEEGLACNLAGGTHHAFPDRGLGYCVLNDVAVAIRDLHTSSAGAPNFYHRYRCPSRQRQQWHFRERQACLHVFDACRAQLSGGEDARFARY